MNRKNKIGLMLAVCLLLMALMPLPVRSEQIPAAPVVVGRVYEMEGNVLRYVPETKDWTRLVKDAPVGLKDTIFAGGDGRAEIILPNGTWLRMGTNTQVQFTALDSSYTQIDLGSGVVRVYDKGEHTAIKVTSDYGYVLAGFGGVFDFYAGSKSIEVIPIQGKVTYVQGSNDTKYDLSVASPSLLADKQHVAAGDGKPDVDWDRWNATRDTFWAERNDARSPSRAYLPQSLQYDASTLDNYGSWRNVNYGGQDVVAWTPTVVSSGWTPYSVGSWTYWNGDQTWIPCEPFGYLTHHYGIWIFVDGGWCWAPPCFGAGFPFFNVGWYWNPGRVGWCYSDYDGCIGWCPLAPWETYYCGHRWGGPFESFVGERGQRWRHHDFNRLANAGHAVVVHQSDFLGTRNLASVVDSRISPATLTANFRSLTTLDTAAINGVSTGNRRFAFTNAPVTARPPSAALERIAFNNAAASASQTPASVVARVNSLPKGAFATNARVSSPITEAAKSALGNGTIRSQPLGASNPAPRSLASTRILSPRETGWSGAEPGIAGATRFPQPPRVFAHSLPVGSAAQDASRMVPSPRVTGWANVTHSDAVVQRPDPPKAFTASRSHSTGLNQTVESRATYRPPVAGQARTESAPAPQVNYERPRITHQSYVESTPPRSIRPSRVVETSPPAVNHSYRSSGYEPSAGRYQAPARNYQPPARSYQPEVGRYQTPDRSYQPRGNYQQSYGGGSFNGGGFSGGGHRGR